MHRSRNRNKNLNNYKTHSRAKAKNEKILLSTYALSTDGKGIARDENNIIVFVKNMLADETGKVEIIQKKSSYKNAVLLHLEKASGLRVAPPCEYFGTCGGCQLQHLDENAQTETKFFWFLVTLKRIGKWDEIQLQTAQSKLSVSYLKKQYYRKRVRFHFNGKEFGFRKNLSKEIVDIKKCLISHYKINEKIPDIKKTILDTWQKIVEKKWATNLECELEITHSEPDKVVLNFANFTTNVPTHSELCQLEIEKQLNILPEQQIRISHPDIQKFKIKKQGFIQPHENCILEYYKFIKQNLNQFLKSHFQNHPAKQNLVAWDLYSGAGIFTALPYFAKDKLPLEIKCLGVEGIKQAIDSLEHNCKGLPVQGLTENVDSFLQKQFELKKTSQDYQSCDIVILDPPRTGMGIKNMQYLVEVSEKNCFVAYVACDPASFARDTLILLEGGFELKELRLFDSFGQTIHYEVIGCFERNISE